MARAETDQEAEDCALELVRSQGLEKVTASALAERIGCAPNTLKNRGWTLTALTEKRLVRDLRTILPHFHPSKVESRQRGADLAAGASAMMRTDIALPQFDALLRPTYDRLKHAQADWDRPSCVGAVGYCQLTVMRALVRQRESALSNFDQLIGPASKCLAAGIVSSRVKSVPETPPLALNLGVTVGSTLMEISTRSLRGVTTIAIAERSGVHRTKLEANLPELLHRALAGGLQLAESALDSLTWRTHPSLERYANAVALLARLRAQGLLVLDRRLLSLHPRLVDRSDKLFRTIRKLAAEACDAGYLQPMVGQTAAALSFATIDGAYGLSDSELDAYLQAFFFGPRTLPQQSPRRWVLSSSRAPPEAVPPSE